MVLRPSVCCGLVAALSLSLLASAAAQPEALYRYWPRFPRPTTLIVVPFVGDHEEGMAFETAAGLAARAVLQSRGDAMLLEDVRNTGYIRWRAGMEKLVQPRCIDVADTWDAIARLRDAGLVRGYVLYRYDANARGFHEQGPIDESVNVATSICSLVDGVAVSERLQQRAEALGLQLLADVRERDEAWCLQQYGDRLSRGLLTMADPKSRVARHLGVALEALTLSRPGPVHDAALARCTPDSPILGWGVGDEMGQTMPASQWGLFQTATNWCHNLPPLMTEQVGETIPREGVSLPDCCRRRLRDLKWETGVHYAAFLMSDGDNVQWMMGNFAGGTEGHYYYESPARGRFPFGWTFPYVDLAQLCPYALEDLFSRATSNDDFVLYGGGYYYPDHFGEKRPDANVLRDHARRIGQYMQCGGLSTIAFNSEDWDGEGALHAYQTFAQEVPGLSGIFTVQYYPYSGGEGKILWVRGPQGERPVISCRLTIWARTGRPRDTTPAGVAAWLNSMPTGVETWTDDCFSFVMPHAWSTFRDTGDSTDAAAEEQGETTTRGLEPVAWAARRLSSHVRVVTPAELALLVRLHLRTRETLTAYADELEPLAQGDEPEAAIRQARALLPAVQDGDQSGEDCFALLQKVDRLVR